MRVFFHVNRKINNMILFMTIYLNKKIVEKIVLSLQSEGDKRKSVCLLFCEGRFRPR